MILVDFDMLAHRCYNAMDYLQTTSGTSTGLEYGCFKILKGLSKRLVGDDKQQIILCLESRLNTWSKQLYPLYKANRTKLPDSFYLRKDKILEHLKQIYHWCLISGHEADQVMYTIAERRNMQEVVFIYTNDSDLFQAIRDNVYVIRSHESKLYYWAAGDLWDKYKVRPKQYAFYKTLTGDKSDNLPGISRLRKDLAAEIARKTQNHFINKQQLKPEQALHMCLIEFMLERMSSKMADKTNEFIMNHLEINLKLIKLKEDLCYNIVEPGGESIQSYLDELEIKSLSYEDETEF